ncbi:GntP family permease [Ligilactobacillus salivarius]|uniref:Gluconate:proton symporter n=1 Tax=Ligilactobacillus salivarius TaxID=1624 RepID=A0A9X6S3W1_9LACO|nr:SLC13 family permease [Ligilactobacillus salivarius]MBL1057487.1 GntP family permease [Ligilactobacillus salivarius]OTF88989.1 gluconate:proton symporter [Ligilactobacillus salivarius]PAY26796.1 gluconate:proton symporter [Ligilactobacillus salivarius]PAY28455.1 gluconate:proton symporter [Ligilactobacillus salivarius]PAY29895.1 gluconate:proton symporter [Ligilactobacillus salivarius]
MGSITIPWFSAIFGLLLAIFLILKKFNPVYSLFIGAIIGCLLGGMSFAQTVNVMISGTQSIIGTAIRVLAAGMLAGVMMESGAAESIAHAIVTKMGNKQALLSLALSTMIITAVGVFIPVAVLIVAPIALSVGKQTGISKLSLLVALSGGGKAGNIISPNPNTIAAANGFHLELSHVMLAGFIPALFGLATSVIVASLVKNKGEFVNSRDIDEEVTEKHIIPLKQALIAPVLSIILLLMNPIGSILHIEVLANFKVDAMYILPFASVIGAIAMGQGREIGSYAKLGLAKVTDTVLILIGAGAIAGLISSSDLSKEIVNLINMAGISGTFLAPISGILMGLAVGSTSTAVILATGSFGNAILGTGTSAIGAAVMVHTGATVIDSVPQGNYFHITAQSMHMSIKDRMKVIPYEACVGGVMTIVATILYGFILN